MSKRLITITVALSFCLQSTGLSYPASAALAKRHALRPMAAAVSDEIEDTPFLQNPDPERIKDANTLSAYIDSLKAEDILSSAEAYETRFLKPLFELFFARLSEDFADSEEFVERCRKIISDKDAYELRERMDDGDKLLQEAFNKIRQRRNTKDASIGFYGLILFHLALSPKAYLRHLYREFMNTRPVRELSLARRGISYHIRGDSIVHFYPKGKIFAGRNPLYDIWPRYEEVPPEDRTDITNPENENARKIKRAIGLWREHIETYPHFAEKDRKRLRERVGRIEESVTVMELDNMRTSLLFSDPEHNVVRVSHAGRTSHGSFFSKHYLDTKDINNDAHMREIAFWLNFDQIFLDVHDRMEDAGATPKEIQRALSGFMKRFLEREDDSHLIEPDILREMLASYMEEDTLIKYKETLEGVIKEQEEIPTVIASEEAIRKATLVQLGELKRTNGHLLYRYEGLGMHLRAKRAYENMKIVTIEAIRRETGLLPCTLLIDMMFTALRFERFDDFIHELKAPLTGRGFVIGREFVRKSEAKEESILTIFFTPAESGPHSFEGDLRHALSRQVEATGAAYVEGIEKEATELLDEYFGRRSKSSSAGKSAVSDIPPAQGIGAITEESYDINIAINSAA